MARRRAALARSLRTRAFVARFPLAVAALNRAGLGPLRANVSSGRAAPRGAAAMGEVAARLGLGDAHVVFGHTHRAGPLPGDDEREWRGPANGRAARHLNAGCWTYDVDLPHLHARREPLLAGHLRARRGLRPAAAASGCSWTARIAALKPRPA